MSRGGHQSSETSGRLTRRHRTRAPAGASCDSKGRLRRQFPVSLFRMVAADYDLINHSACVLSLRRSGIFLRLSFIVAPLLSLNGTLGMFVFCRLSLIRNLLFLTVPTSIKIRDLVKTLSLFKKSGVDTGQQRHQPPSGRPVPHPLPAWPDRRQFPAFASAFCAAVHLINVR